MELQSLGFDRWFQDKRSEALRQDCTVARVTAVHKDSYLVRNNNSEVFAELAGSFIYSAVSSRDLPSVGDWALVQYHNTDTFAIIHGLLPRKSFLRRKTPGKVIDYQMIAVNIDSALIVQACDFDFNLRRLERYLVMANEGNIEPILLLTKSDLVSPEKMAQRISQDYRGRCYLHCITLNARIVSGFGFFPTTQRK